MTNIAWVIALIIGTFLQTAVIANPVQKDPYCKAEASGVSVWANGKKFAARTFGDDQDVISNAQKICQDAITRNLNACVVRSSTETIQVQESRTAAANINKFGKPASRVVKVLKFVNPMEWALLEMFRTEYDTESECVASFGFMALKQHPGNRFSEIERINMIQEAQNPK
jgi:hypothetical protein